MRFFWRLPVQNPRLLCKGRLHGRVIRHTCAAIAGIQRVERNHFDFLVPLPFGFGFGFPPIVSFDPYPTPFGMTDSYVIDVVLLGTICTRHYTMSETFFLAHILQLW